MAEGLRFLALAVCINKIGTAVFERGVSKIAANELSGSRAASVLELVPAADIAGTHRAETLADAVDGISWHETQGRRVKFVRAQALSPSLFADVVLLAIVIGAQDCTPRSASLVSLALLARRREGRRGSRLVELVSRSRKV